MHGIPGMRVWCPADAEDMAIGLPTLLVDPYPWYIRYNPLPAPFAHDTDFHVGAPRSWPRAAMSRSSAMALCWANDIAPARGSTSTACPRSYQPALLEARG
ncbi:MAG: hypothetical protein ACREWG_12030 [Gammaproteobacteria bacterium]